MPRNNDKLGSVQYRSIGLAPPLLKAACLAEAEEAQRKINERHTKRREDSTKKGLSAAAAKRCK
jgi:hypothetical protein